MVGGSLPLANARGSVTDCDSEEIRVRWNGVTDCGWEAIRYRSKANRVWWEAIRVWPKAIRLRRNAIPGVVERDSGAVEKRFGCGRDMLVSRYRRALVLGDRESRRDFGEYFKVPVDIGFGMLHR